MNILQKSTWKVLMKNKTHTWVTIIGILLSAAMFTAVTTCVSSMQNFMMRTVIATDGSWHGRQYNVNGAHVAALRGNEEIEELLVFEKIGYAPIGSSNDYKPYLMVEGVSGKVGELLPFEITSGRMPENSNELLIPNHLYTNGNVELALGDTLTLSIGDRNDQTLPLDQRQGFREGETFVARENRTYTVVGFYNRFPYTIERYEAPGYTALTVSDLLEPATADVYLRMKNPLDIYDIQGVVDTNEDLLQTMGLSLNSSYLRVLYGLSAILMGIILFGSVALIYNAFSISVSERTKQFGVLQTVGATKRQIKSNVYFEAMVLSAIGIPLGILSGILGIAVTLRCTQGMFDALLENYGVRLQLYVSPLAVVLAAVIALVTVLLSARIPARRAIRQNAIDAVRQTADLSIRAKKVRTPRWVYRIFGFEGMLADKNFKRNRKKYRATVLSLFMSVVLFISASSYCAYLTNAVNTVTDVGAYDISYYFSSEQITTEEFNAQLDQLKSVDSYVYYHRHYYHLTIEDRYLAEDFLEAQKEEREQMQNHGDEQSIDDRISAYLYFFDDETFRNWAREQGIDPEGYFNQEEIQAIAINSSIYWNGTQYEPQNFLKGTETPYSFTHVPHTLEGYTCVDSREDEQGTVWYIYENEAGETRSYSEKDPLLNRFGTITAIAKETPLGTNQNTLQLVFPQSMRETVLSPDSYLHYEYQIKAEDHRGAERELESLLKLLPVIDTGVYNMRASTESEQALVIVINVFSYGFIILISLIALANVFNTISTNIALRRREFAMLRSVGMSEKALRRMMNYECILYGAKGLFSGLVGAVVVTFFIYLVVNVGFVTDFYIPWYSITVAVAAVFIVVFATMLYSMKKFKGEDPIEALKNENL